MSMKQQDETLRIHTVVFPTDGSAWAEHAFAQAAFYAANHDAALHVLTVRPGRAGQPAVTAPGLVTDAFRDQLRTAAADSIGLDLILADLEATSPEDGILDYAERVDADLVVMSTHGRTGLSRLLVGSVAEAVARRAHCPVLTVRPTAERAVVRARRILVPTDFSAMAYHALAHAVALARLHGAALDLVHIVEPHPEPGLAGAVVGWGEDRPHRVEEARMALRDLTEEVEFDGLPVALHALIGQPALGVLEAAEKLDSDLIVMGTHGRTGARRFFLGSVAEKVVQLAPCPAFVVKPFGKPLYPTATDRLFGSQPARRAEHH